METGIETKFDVQLQDGPRGPKVSGPCGGYCKSSIVQGHEGEHRKNMGACCDRRNACLKIADTFPPEEIDRARRNCQAIWGLWKSANSKDLEKRAAVEPCRLAKQFKKNCSPCTGPGNWRICCIEATEEECLACPKMDACSPIESCPFHADGFPDNDAITRNRKKSGQNPEFLPASR